MIFETHNSVEIDNTSLNYQKNLLCFGSPKTETCHRPIPLPKIGMLTLF